MKVSLNLLKQYVDLEGLTPEQIAHRLTFAGVEVESITKLAFGSKLVVGEVIFCENMENSDHLHLTKVNCGPKYGTLDIVCGAPNCRKGLKVIVALDGCVLPGGTIKQGQIRGHASNGMLCSLLELGVDSKYLSDEQTKGIEELPHSFEVGDENVLSLLGLDDTILDLKLLANRSDMYSLLNVAKEINTLFNKKLHFPKVVVNETFKSNFSVDSKSEKCPQFSARVVKGIETKESPKWMKEALRSSGIRSINNIVDIGNYVMLVTGQPLHMYDLDKLEKQELIVRDDFEGDFVALDEKVYKIQKGDICITSNGKVMCLGGIMGSLACAVDENTKNIVIEAANFDYASIRRTSIRLNLSSDSSQRFVKGINPNQYNFVMDFTVDLLISLAEAKEIAEINTYLKNEFKTTEIETSIDYINGRLGTNFSKEEIINALKSAHIEIKENDGNIIAKIPDQRIDITGEADLSEEVIRILGFEHIQAKLPATELFVGGLEPDLEKKRIVRNYLRGIGLDEVLCYSLMRESEIKDFQILNKDESFHVLNPLTDEHEYVRTNLLPSLMNTLVFNKNHSNDNVAIFEVSDIYSLPSNKHIHLGIALTGNDVRRFALSGEQYNYYHVKGVSDSLLSLFGIDEKRINLERCSLPEFHPGKSAILKIDGKIAGVFGELHPNTLKKYHLENDNVAVLEMDLGIVFSTKTGLKKMEEISRYQSVKRDFAFIIADKISSSEVLIEVRKINRDLIKKVEVFDVYKGVHVEEGHYSLAFSTYINSNEKTLSDKEISSVEEQIIKGIELKFGAKLRK